MALRRYVCLVLGHRYRYAGVMLGKGFERCERCGGTRVMRLLLAASDR